MAPLISPAGALTKVTAILEHVATLQAADGELPAQRRFHGQPYPGVPRSPYATWYDFGKCPFFTATTAYHLQALPGPVARTTLERACDFLSGCFERDLVRYVPSRYQDIWFPTDVDDTCLTKKALHDAGRRFPDDDRHLLANRNRRGQFYTWFVPRLRHLREPRYAWWLVADAWQWMRRLVKQNPRNAWRLMKEYWSTQEPAVDANLLLYFGNDPRIGGLAELVVGSLRVRSVSLEYYDSLLVPYFHIARAHHEGVIGLHPVRADFLNYLRERTSEGGAWTGFECAMITLSLMYFDCWEDPALENAIEVIYHDPMHEQGWLPVAYANPVNREFSDGSAALTAVLYADALQRYATHFTRADPAAE